MCVCRKGSQSQTNIIIYPDIHFKRLSFGATKSDMWLSWLGTIYTLTCSVVITSRSEANLEAISCVARSFSSSSSGGANWLGDFLVLLEADPSLLKEGEMAPSSFSSTAGLFWPLLNQFNLQGSHFFDFLFRFAAMISSSLYEIDPEIVDAGREERGVAVVSEGAIGSCMLNRETS